MNLVPRLLEWVRTLLFGALESGRLALDADQDDDPSVAPPCPSPEMWGAILIHARRRRAQRQRFVPAPGADSPVRAYASPANGQARALAMSAQEAR